MSLETFKARVPLLLLVISVAFNVALSRRIVALQEEPVGSLEPGTRVAPLDVKSLTGEPAKIVYGDTQIPTLLYYFSPTCGWCDRNWDNMRALSLASTGRFRLVGLSPTAKGVEEVLRKHDLSFPVYTGLSAEAAREYHFAGTPETVLVSTIGTVLRAWPGAYGPSRISEVEDYFGVKLPGLAPPAQN